jgi:hypothetical protein
MSEEAPQIQTPEDIVAAEITTALEESGLLKVERSEEVRSALASGQLTSEDWYHEIDLATAPKEGEDEQ